MIFLIFILNFLSADELKLNFIDWNYDTKIEIDSLNIINQDYGIDTTLINPKSVDLKNLLIINSVELKNFGVVYINNILKITSKEIINHIEIIDLLGKKLLEDSPNTYNFEKNISLNENLSFIILTIGNKRYSQKLYNVNQEIYQSPSILLSSKDKWQFTPYKDKYRDTTYIFTDDMLQSDSLDIELKKERYKVNMSFTIDSVMFNHSVYYIRPDYPGEDKNENKNSHINKSVSIVLNDGKIKKGYGFVPGFVNCYGAPLESRNLSLEGLIYDFNVNEGGSGEYNANKSAFIVYTNKDNVINKIEYENTNFTFAYGTNSCNGFDFSVSIENILPLTDEAIYTQDIKQSNFFYSSFNNYEDRYVNSSTSSRNITSVINSYITITIEKLD